MATDPIQAMAKKAAEEIDAECVDSIGEWCGASEECESIIARHYRELIDADIEFLAKLAEREKQVRELVLAARKVHTAHYSGTSPALWQAMDALRAALEPFKDVK